MASATEPSAAMISVERALEQILALCQRLPAERLPIAAAAGQILAQDVQAAFDIPPHDNTAMDGYAVQANDTAGASAQRPRRLQVIGELAAGHVSMDRVGTGQALRIMTGAPMPPGADSVVPFEETDESGLRAPGTEHNAVTEVAVLKQAEPGANVRRRGEDVRAGTRSLRSGTLLRAAQIGLLASLGVAQVEVYRRPRVAILSTGDELLDIGQPPAPGKIYDSNAYALEALVREYGGIPLCLGIAADTIDALTARIREALDPACGADLLVTSAGVSRGDYDIVKEVLAREGEIHFWTVRMKPGKPLAFGSFPAPTPPGQHAERRVPHIGLPGNPVSSLLAFELFGRPAIFKMLGRPFQPRPSVRAIADDPIRNSDGRRVYARAIVSRGDDGRWHTALTGPQGSGILSSMALANGLAICPEDRSEIHPGDEVDVVMLAWEQPAD